MIAKDELAVIGNELKNEREAKNLRIKDVANILRIRAIYLEYLEKGQIDQLPSGVYVDCYIKSYAEFLGIKRDKYTIEPANKNCKTSPIEMQLSKFYKVLSFYKSFFSAATPHKFLLIFCILLLFLLLF